MDLKGLPKLLEKEVKNHLVDGYKLLKYENNEVTMIKKKKITIGLFLINILTLRWLIYIWLPNILIIDIIGIKYFLYFKEVNGKIELTTG
ncbi:MAG: hypothetical protein COA86_14375 [Kangiella sp.]|nr:MAG: hypothetical protein COA86_14375 [Kangiella sp.]